jgi:hypothetical protein
MTFRSMDQLRSLVWDSEKEAITELKRNGFKPVGDDYRVELNKETDKWWIADRRDDASQPLNTGKKASPISRIKAATKKPVKAAEVVQMPKKQGPQKKKAETKAETPEQPPVPHGGDISALSPDDGPYTLRIEAANVTQNSVNYSALDISKAAKRPVTVVNAKGEAVRVIDYAVRQEYERSLRKSSGTRRIGEQRDDSKRGQCSALLLRDKGATGAELDAIVGRKVGEPFIRRLADRAKAKMEKIGDRHWRLVK